MGSTTTLLPWVAVNERMHDEYRQSVAEAALAHLPNASPDLAHYAKDRLEKYIKIQGFRSWTERAPLTKRLNAVIERMQNNNEVMTAIISLWAESRMDTLRELQLEAERARVQFRQGVSWQDCTHGFVIYKGLPVLAEVAEQMGINRLERERDDLFLGALWLSLAVELSEEKTDDIEKDVDFSASSSFDNRNSVLLHSDRQTMEINNEIPVQGQEVSVAVPDKHTTSELESTLSKATELFNHTEDVYQTLIAKAGNLQQALRDSHFEQVSREYADIGLILQRWGEQRKSVTSLLTKANSAILELIAQWRDLSTRISPVVSWENEATTDLTPIVEYFNATFKEIRAYIAEQHELILEVGRLQSSMAKLQDEYQQWAETDSTEALSQTVGLGDHYEQTVEYLRKLKRDIAVRCTQLQRMTKSYADANETSIKQLYTKINELNIDHHTTRSALKVDSIQDFIADLTQKSIVERKIRERELISFHERLMIETAWNRISEFSSQLQIEWNQTSFVDLIGESATRGFDFEMILLLLSVGYREKLTTSMHLPDKAFGALITMLYRLENQKNGHGTLHLMVKALFSWITTENHQMNVRRCIAALAANYSSPEALPSGFLWGVSAEWPDPQMSSWGKLWQAARDGSEIIIDREQQVDSLKLRRTIVLSQALETFRRENTGFFRRTRSVQDRKYRKILNEHLLPEAEASYKRIMEWAKSVLEDSTHHIPLHEKQLRKELAQIKRKLENDEFTNLVEKGLAAEGLSDFHAFHSRTTASNIKECYKILENLVVLLLDWIEHKAEQNENIESSLLHEELIKHFGEGSPETAVLDALIAYFSSGPVEVGASVTSSIDTFFEHEILTNPTYVQRLPRLVSRLMKHKFSWGDVYLFVLSDLSQPIEDPGDIVNLFLESGGATQAGFLLERLPVDMQKKVLSTTSDLKNTISTIEKEILSFGVDPIDLEPLLALGRWFTAISQLRQQAEELTHNNLERHRRLRERSSDLRRALNDIDTRLFSRHEQMNVDAFKLIESGINLAKTAVSEMSSFDFIQEFIDNVRHWIDYESFVISDIQIAVTRLDENTKKPNTPADVNYTMKSVLAILESGHYEELGLVEDSLDESKVSTRQNLLREFLYLRDQITVSRGQKLEEESIAKIRLLYRYFSVMIPMKFAETQQGEKRQFVDPLVFSVYRLMYPRTPVLNDDITFISLPGSTINQHAIEDIDQTLENFGWFESGFVVLFIPACTKAIKQRLSNIYANRGLVVIDETTIIDLILAEKDSLVPLARFRAMLLNSKGAGRIDVFKIDQSVHAQTSIFVGRDTLVNRVVTSGQNYVIYGGRRIGKSSVLNEVKQRLEASNIRVVYHSFEGDGDCRDDTAARRLARQLDININSVNEFKQSVHDYLVAKGQRVVFLLDEIDLYIHQNPNRHILIQSLRALSDEFADRFRVIVVGFMRLYQCLKGRGPYTPSSDPWIRMFNDQIGPLSNLSANQAERIVIEGFREILGWSFENHRIPKLIVERTGGHPLCVYNK